MPDDYIQITSGLGEAPPRNIIVLPVLFEGEVKAVIELASFLPFSQIHQTFLDQLAESIGVVLNMIGANMRTEELLEQSQKLTQELQSQSKELQQQQDELDNHRTGDAPWGNRRAGHSAEEQVDEGGRPEQQKHADQHPVESAWLESSDPAPPAGARIHAHKRSDVHPVRNPPRE